MRRTLGTMASLAVMGFCLAVFGGATYVVFFAEGAPPLGKPMPATEPDPVRQLAVYALIGSGAGLLALCAYPVVARRVRNAVYGRRRSRRTSAARKGKSKSKRGRSRKSHA